MKRPISVTVFAVLDLIAAMFGLAGILIMATGGLTPVQGGPPNPILDVMKEQPVYAGWMKVNMVTGTITSLLLAVAAIGLLRLKEWGRRLIVIICWLAIGFGVLGTGLNYVYVFKPFMARASQAQGVEAFALTAAAIGALFGTLVSALFYVLQLFFMTRPKVKAAFAPLPPVATAPLSPPP